MKDTDERLSAPREQSQWFGGTSRDLFGRDTELGASSTQHVPARDMGIAGAEDHPQPNSSSLLDLSFNSPPVSAQDISDRTTENRIDLADNVPLVANVPEYGGYLDVVMHGDARGTQAHVGGVATDFTLDETVEMIRACPVWEERPVRLMSCSTGEAGYAQDLADALEVPVYAPTDLLEVRDDGTLYIHNGGSWKRFEPVI